MTTAHTPAALLLASLCAIAGSAHAQLSPRYQDANQDLVADTPTDPARWRDPNILIFAYTPVEDPAMYSKVWDEFIAHLEAATGKDVRFFPVQSNAAQLERHARRQAACGGLQYGFYADRRELCRLRALCHDVGQRR